MERGTSRGAEGDLSESCIATSLTLTVYPNVCQELQTAAQPRARCAIACEEDGATRRLPGAPRARRREARRTRASAARSSSSPPASSASTSTGAAARRASDSVHVRPARSARAQRASRSANPVPPEPGNERAGWNERKRSGATASKLVARQNIGSLLEEELGCADRLVVAGSRRRRPPCAARAPRRRAPRAASRRARSRDRLRGPEAAGSRRGVERTRVATTTASKPRASPGVDPRASRARPRAARARPRASRRSGRSRRGAGAALDAEQPAGRLRRLVDRDLVAAPSGRPRAPRDPQARRRRRARAAARRRAPAAARPRGRRPG